MKNLGILSLDDIYTNMGLLVPDQCSTYKTIYFYKCQYQKVLFKKYLFDIMKLYNENRIFI